MTAKRDGVRRRVGDAIGGAIDAAVDGVGAAGELLVDVLRPSKLSTASVRGKQVAPGSAAGVEHAEGAQTPPPEGAVRFVVCDYSPERLERHEPSLDQLLAESQPQWAKVRWIRVEGLHSYVINGLREHFNFSSLAAEDALHKPQRPRAEAYDDHLFIVGQLWEAGESDAGLQQISLFLFDGLLLSFQEQRTGIWDPIEKRLQQSSSNLRGADASYLAYALLDTIVDHDFPNLEAYAEQLDQLEDVVLKGRGLDVLQQIHAVKHGLAVRRRMLWPTRELVVDLRRDDQVLISAETRAYLADVHDHCTQLIDFVETLRDLASSLTDLHLSMMSNRTNEAMQVLTVIATIFIPITFLAGVYGMNFKYIPEMEWRYSYAAFWALCATITGGLLWYFRRHGWFGR
ncbi:MAG: magnesium/cobalt transporter CorA [Myxococcales bacterium]|nr:magnesium/cobalt transporter CorA [Myxococcales bacterium]